MIVIIISNDNSSIYDYIVIYQYESIVMIIWLYSNSDSY